MADRFKLRRGPKNNIDLNVYELGYATDSDEERLYFNNGSMVPIPNNKDITDIKTELTETTNVTNKNKQDVSELKESVAGIIKTGVAKLVQYSYDIELSENTKKVNIPYERYSSVTDTLKVYVNGLAIQNDQYTITDPVENEGIVTNGYIVLKVERPAGTIVRIEVWKNVPSGEEGEVSGNIITKNSLPLNRIIGINDIRNNQNILINGDFSVNQRGTEFIDVKGYTSDRWYFACFNEPHSTNGAKGKISFINNQCLITNFNNLQNYIIQVVETKTTQQLCGKQVTLSAYIKSENATKGSVFVQLVGNGQTDNLWGNQDQRVLAEKTYGCLNIEEYTLCTITAIIPEDIKSIRVSIGSHFEYGKGMPDNTAKVYIKNVKLEVGAEVTPFVPRSYAEELALCQRYCQELIPSGANYGIIGSGFISDRSNSVIIYIPLVCEMRIKPTISVSGNYTFRTTGGALNSPVIKDFRMDNMLNNGINVNSSFDSSVSNPPPSGSAGQIWLADSPGSFLLDAEIY